MVRETPVELLWDSQMVEEEISVHLSLAKTLMAEASRMDADAISTETPRGRAAEYVCRTAHLNALQAITLAIIRLEHTLSCAFARWETVPVPCATLHSTSDAERLPPDKTAAGE